MKKTNKNTTFVCPTCFINSSRYHIYDDETFSILGVRAHISITVEKSAPIVVDLVSQRFQTFCVLFRDVPVHFATDSKTLSSRDSVVCLF